MGAMECMLNRLNKDGLGTYPGLGASPRLFLAVCQQHLFLDALWSKDLSYRAMQRPQQKVGGREQKRGQGGLDSVEMMSYAQKVRSVRHEMSPRLLLPSQG